MPAPAAVAALSAEAIPFQDQPTIQSPAQTVKRPPLQANGIPEAQEPAAF